MSKVPLDRVIEFEDRFVEIVRTKYKENILDVLSNGVMNDEVGKLIEEAADKTIQELGI